MGNVLNCEDKMSFLMFGYFNTTEITVKAASNRAYRDLCRTLRGLNGDGNQYRKIVNDDILNEDNIETLFNEITKDGFTDRHRAICEELITFYTSKGVDFTYGHAQKWVNMLMKYLYVFGCKDTDEFKYMHMPLDSYIFKELDEAEIDPPSGFKKWSQLQWSKLTEEDYDKYQKIIATNIPNQLKWELEHWLKAAEERTELTNC